MESEEEETGLVARRLRDQKGKKEKSKLIYLDEMVDFEKRRELDKGRRLAPNYRDSSLYERIIMDIPPQIEEAQAELVEA